MRCKTKFVYVFGFVLVSLCLTPLAFARNYYLTHPTYFRQNGKQIAFDSSLYPLKFTSLYKDASQRWHFNSTWVTSNVDINITGFINDTWYNYSTSAGTQNIYLGREPNAVYFDDVLNTTGWSYSGGVVTLNPSGTDVSIDYLLSITEPITLPSYSQYSYMLLYGSNVTLLIEKNCTICFANYDAGITVNVSNGTLNGTATFQYTNDRGEISFVSQNNATFTVSQYLDGVPHISGATSSSGSTSLIYATTTEGDSLKFWWGKAIEPALPYMFILGIIGVFSFFGGAVYGAKLLKDGEYEEAIIQGTIFMSLGFGLILAWLMG